MIRSLWTAATGMNAQQFNIDTIANNLANVNTTSFKKSRADFEDLIYQTLKLAGSPATEETVVPTGVQVGLGVKTAASQKLCDQGSLQNTGNLLDIALEGKGFFQIQMEDGSLAYTRDGSFKVDAEGQMVNSNGLKLLPEVSFGETIDPNSIAISKQGLITARDLNTDEIIEVAQLQTHRFINPAGLSNIGGNLYRVTEASGAAIEGLPGTEGHQRCCRDFWKCRT